MAKVLRCKPIGEKLSYDNHPEYEIRETRVSEYLRRYGTGHIEDLPQTSAPEVSDERSVDQMLEDEFTPHMSTETVDVLMMIDENRERFEKAAQDIEMTDKMRQKYENAMRVINDSNASMDAKREAYSVLDSLISNGYARARD
jgi:hypothetical protein